MDKERRKEMLNEELKALYGDENKDLQEFIDWGVLRWNNLLQIYSGEPEHIIMRKLLREAYKNIKENE